MFSANENILLRQHKRRIIQYVESTIPESALDLGTTVMVMQVSCKSPGCVPLETCVTVVFPRPPTKKKKKKTTSTMTANEKKEAEEGEEKITPPPSFPEPLLPNLPESQTGGSFKTRILKPLSDVTMDDVLDALPPSFEGGRRTWESVCLKARDVVFAQIGQIVGGGDDAADASSDAVADGSEKEKEEDFQRRKMVAEYLKVCLQEYIDRGCVAPEWGEPFPPLKKDQKLEDQTTTTTKNEEKGEAAVEEKAKEEKSKGEDDNDDDTKNNTNNSNNKTKSIMTMDDKFGKGNFVFRRPLDTNDDEKTSKDETRSKILFNNTGNYSMTTTNRIRSGSSKSNSNKKNNIKSNNSMNGANAIASSQQLLNQMEKHAPGIRRPGCPCCDPDSASSYADKMMF